MQFFLKPAPQAQTPLQKTIEWEDRSGSPSRGQAAQKLRMHHLRAKLRVKVSSGATLQQQTQLAERERPAALQRRPRAEMRLRAHLPVKVGSQYAR